MLHPPKPPPQKNTTLSPFATRPEVPCRIFEHNIPARAREKQSAGLYNGSTYIKIYYNYARNCNCKMFPSPIISSQNTVVLYYLLCYIHPLQGEGKKCHMCWQGIYVVHAISATREGLSTATEPPGMKIIMKEKL